MMYEINKLPLAITLGYQGESLVRTIEVDCADWLETYPTGTMAATILLPGYGGVAPLPVDMDGTVMRIPVTRGMTAKAGRGSINLKLLDGDIEKRSAVIPVYIQASHPPVTGEMPDPVQDWVSAAQAKLGEVDHFVDETIAATEAANEAASAAQLAAGTASPAGTYADLAALIAANPDHSKIYITLDDGNWCYWDGTAFVAGGVYQAASVAADIDNLTTQLEQTNIYMDEYLINVKKYGVKGDGLTNDYAAIQTVINEHRNVYFPEGEYMLGLGIGLANRGIYIPSNATILFHPRAKLKLLPHDKTYYEIFHLVDVENVKIINPVIDGNRDNNAATTGEHGMGIAMRGAKNVVIKNANITNCWGDGIYVGLSDNVLYSENIVMENPICDNNRRQGMSIISVKGLHLINPTFLNTNGTSPESGIDIEPNGNDEFLQDIVIENYKAKTNEVAGLKFYLKSYSNSLNPVSITVKNMVSDGDDYGLYVTGGENIHGFINIENPTFLNNKFNGVRVLEYNYVNPLLKITNPYINNNNAGSYTGPLNSAAISIFNPLESVSAYDIGNISIENLIVEEIRTNKVIETAIYIENEINVNGVRDIHIIDPIKLDVPTNSNMVLYGDGITIKDGNNILTRDMNDQSQPVYEHKNIIKYTTKGNTGTKTIDILQGSRIGRTLEFVNVTGTSLIVYLHDENILTLEGANVSCAQKGGSLAIKKISSTDWLVLNKVGTWTAT